MAPPEQPPLWMWIVIGVLGLVALLLLVNDQSGLALPKRKTKLD